MYMKITIVLMVLVFCRGKGFKMEQCEAIKFCVTLNKTATET
jgi:hypothetical protein